MREITLRLTEQEFRAIEDFLDRGGLEHFYAYGDDVLAIDMSGGFIFAESPYVDASVAPIAAALNGLLRSRSGWTKSELYSAEAGTLSPEDVARRGSLYIGEDDEEENTV
jgi:hypothetical protein